MILNRNSYSPLFINLLEKINSLNQENLTNNINNNDDTFRSLTTTIQEEMYENLLDIKNPSEILTEFCNHYKFNISFDIDNNNANYDQNKQYIC